MTTLEQAAETIGAASTTDGGYVEVRRTDHEIILGGDRQGLLRIVFTLLCTVSPVLIFTSTRPAPSFASRRWLSDIGNERTPNDRDAEWS